MRELFNVSIMNDEAILSFVGGDDADVGRKRLGNMYASDAYADYSNYASRIKFTTDNLGATKVSFVITHAVWYPFENNADQYLIYDGGETSHQVREGEIYSLTESFKYAIVTEAQKDALINYTSQHWADAYARADAALEASGYIVKNQPIRVTSAEGRMDNNGEVITAEQAKGIATLSGEYDILLEPNTTYYIWLYSTFNQTFVVRPFMFTGYGHNGQVIVYLDGAYGAHWMPATVYLYANNQWNDIT